MSNRYQDIAEALIALAQCVPDTVTIFVHPDHGSGVDFHMTSDERARAVAAAFGIELRLVDNAKQCWLAGSGCDRPHISVYGPVRNIGDAKTLDEVQVDAALAQAKQVSP